MHQKTGFPLEQGRGRREENGPVRNKKGEAKYMTHGRSVFYRWRRNRRSESSLGTTGLDWSPHGSKKYSEEEEECKNVFFFLALYPRGMESKDENQEIRHC